MITMTEITERDIERLAQSAAAASSCDRLIGSPSFDLVDREALARVRDFVIEQTATSARLFRSTADMDAVLFGRPAILKAAIRSRLTPGQLAQLAARLGTE
jgi:hypothetical protein